MSRLSQKRYKHWLIDKSCRGLCVQAIALTSKGKQLGLMLTSPETPKVSNKEQAKTRVMVLSCLRPRPRIALKRRQVRIRPVYDTFETVSMLFAKRGAVTNPDIDESRAFPLAVFRHVNVLRSARPLRMSKDARDLGRPGAEFASYPKAIYHWFSYAFARICRPSSVCEFGKSLLRRGFSGQSLSLALYHRTC
jgi:hypothetical protein